MATETFLKNLEQKTKSTNQQWYVYPANPHKESPYRPLRTICNGTLTCPIIYAAGKTGTSGKLTQSAQTLGLTQTELTAIVTALDAMHPNVKRPPDLAELIEAIEEICRPKSITYQEFESLNAPTTNEESNP
jgi:hypothetical protein